MTALLDINVLIALFDPEHIHHDAAHAWFGSRGRSPWATCPLTENGFVRIVSSPSYRGRETTVQDASHRLRRLCQREDHVFWPDSLSLRDPDHITAGNIRGHRQVTDVYLLALAVRNDGVLATFDTSIHAVAVPGASDDSVVDLSKWRAR